MSVKDKINSNIIPYLDEIANRLFANQAAIMVGAGFSKNAIPSGFSEKRFLDWNELGNEFYKKLNGCYPTKTENYLNVLRLANEVEAAFGRKVLDTILQDNIPDVNYIPSELHKKLLNLPWTDIFTTNYDTLLERSAETLVDYKYTIVRNKDDLIGAIKPRIIKLHGTFPSSRPFIITEEDYRKYPKDFAPFVNTVQQSLLENTLCLLGFSGTDPNFLQWIGWIRDNLGKNVPKIYLIGTFSFSEAQLKLFEQQNIIVVNIIVAESANNKHYDALDLFIEYLNEQEQKKNKNFYDWSYHEEPIFHFTEQYKNKPIELFEKAIQNWKNLRLSYPSWVILPETKRTALQYETFQGIEVFLKYKDALSDTILFDFLGELIWRLDIILYPITLEIASIIENVISKNNYREKNLSSFLIALMRCYRRCGEIEKWNNASDRFASKQDLYQKETILEYKYEKTLNALFHLNYKEIKKNLSEWEIDSSFPFMNAKKAGLLAEIGEVVEAKKILEQALIDIRRLQISSDIDNNCLLLSQEAYIISLYENIIFSSPVRYNKNSDDKDIDYNQVHEKYSGRLIELQKKLINPDQENKYFKLVLTTMYKVVPLFEEKNEFEIQNKSYIRHFGEDTKPLKNALAFLIFTEKIGQPFSIFSRGGKLNISIDVANGAAQRIANHYSFWAISICCRLDDDKLSEQLFSREKIANFSSEYANNLCKDFLETLDENEIEIKKIFDNNQMSFPQILAKSLPELISRLCCRCDFHAKKKILNFIKKNYSCAERRQYQKLDNLTKRFMKSLSVNEQIELFKDIVNIDIPNTIVPIEQGKLVPLTFYLSISRKDITNNRKETFTDEQLEKFFVAMESKNDFIRQWGINVLTELFELDCFTVKQTNKFKKNLWKKTDEKTHLPAKTNYMLYSFLNLPHPKSINIKKLLKTYILEFSLPNYKTLTVRTFNSRDEIVEYFREIIFCEYFLHWSYDEFSILIKKMYKFWENGKEYTEKDDFWGDSEVYNQCIAMKQALAVLCRSVKNIKDKEREIIQSFINEFPKYGINSLELEFSCLNWFQKEFNVLLVKIKEKLITSDSDVVADGMKSFLAILKQSRNKILIMKIWQEISQCILYKRDDSLVTSLNYLSSTLTKKYIGTMPKEIKNNFLIFLKAMAKETDLNNSNNLEIALKLAIRENCASLAFNFYLEYLKQKENVPTEVLLWKDICNSNSEFAEIRNAWRDL